MNTKEYVAPSETVIKATMMWHRAVEVLGKHSYQGTVTDAEKAKRRAANKVAKASRKVNRG